MAPSFPSETYSKKYLENLIANKVEEDYQLEYKGSNALGNSDGKKAEIAKDVSAMANANGGTIFYGIKEDESNRIPTEIDAVIAKKFSKDTLDQIISSNISPKIQVSINPIEIDNESVVYAVDVPQGNTAHQSTKSRRYYKRSNTTIEPMLDYEIRDLMNRYQKPELRPCFEASVIKMSQSWLSIPVIIENQSHIQALDVLIKFIAHSNNSDVQHVNNNRGGGPILPQNGDFHIDFFPEDNRKRLYFHKHVRNEVGIVNVNLRKIPTEQFPYSLLFSIIILCKDTIPRKYLYTLLIEFDGSTTVALNDEIILD